jgi:hypothetical protein
MAEAGWKMFCKVEGSEEVARGFGYLLIDAKPGPRTRNFARRVVDGEGGLKLLQLILCGFGAGRPNLNQDSGGAC